MLIKTKSTEMNIKPKPDNLAEFQTQFAVVLSQVIDLHVGDYLLAGDVKGFSVKIGRTGHNRYDLIITKPGEPQNSRSKLDSKTAMMLFAASFPIVYNRSV